MSLTLAITVVLSMVSPAAVGAPPPGPEQLHKSAVAAYRAGKATRALALWTEAEAMSPDWRFAFNIGVIHADAGRWPPAWSALERADSLGIPEEKRPLVTSVRDEVEAGLARDHAFLELSVVPPAARVERDGTPWASPQRGWFTTSSSQVTVSAPGHDPMTLAIPHAVGQRTRVPITLTKTRPMGRAIIETEPPGAAVFVDGQPSSPSPATLDLSMGDHEVVVVFPGEDRQRKAVTVREGDVHRLRFTALPVVAPVVPTPPYGRALEWSLLGSGLALGAIGGGLLGWSGSVSNDIDALNAAPPTAYDDYRSRYEALSGRQDATWASGWTLVGLGVSALITSTCFWWLSDVTPEATPSAP